MKIMPAIFILLLTVSAMSIFPQDRKPVYGVNGEKAIIDKGWKLIEMLPDINGKKVSLLYTYQVDSVVKISPHSFKFWIKIKDFDKITETNYSLFAYSIKCDHREIRTGKIIYKKYTGASEAIENPNPNYDDVEPGSLDEMVFNVICKEYDKSPNPSIMRFGGSF